MASFDLQKVDRRNKLRPRREPYWHRLEAGQFLGFRKMSPDAVGSWVLRTRDAGTGGQKYHALGEFDELAPAARFDAAKRAALIVMARVEKGVSTEPVTVRKACELYATHIRTAKGGAAADDIVARYRRHVDTDTLGASVLEKLTREHLRSWRARMVAKPRGSSAKTEQARRAPAGPRSEAAINRDMAALRAALNYALAEGMTTSDFAWAVPLRPIKNADGRRTLYLDKGQRRALIAAAVADVANLLRGLALLPLRPGALAGLTVGDFDKKLGVLTVGKDKAGNDRRLGLPKATAAFFASMAEGKLPGAPLLARADGSAWDKDAWKHPVKEAAAAAGLPPETTAYTLRHSTITDLVQGGLDLLTTAQLSGTSVAMIEKHYGHLSREHAATALAGLAL